MRKFVSPGNAGEIPADRAGERGLTLIELMASLTLLSVVLGVIYASITFGVNAYHKVSIENKLRDEGDLIMSSIISELYRMGPERITQSLSSDQSITLVMPKTGEAALNEEVIAFQENADGKDALFIGSRADVDQRKSEIATEAAIVLAAKHAPSQGEASGGASTGAGVGSGAGNGSADSQEAGVSFIKLNCFGSPVNVGCKSGLIEIRLKLRQTYGGSNYDLDLESKFGF